CAGAQACDGAQGACVDRWGIRRNRTGMDAASSRDMPSQSSEASTERRLPKRHRGVPPPAKRVHSGSVVVGIDPADEPARTLGVAGARATGLGTSLVVCHVERNDERDGELRAEIDTWVREVCPEAHEVSVELRHGDPADELLACADEHDAQLIV